MNDDLMSDFYFEVPEGNPGYYEQVERLMEIQNGLCGVCGGHLL